MRPTFVSGRVPGLDGRVVFAPQIAEAILGGLMRKTGRPWFHRTVLFNVLFVIVASLVPQAVFFGFFSHAYDEEVKANGLADATKIE